MKAFFFIAAGMEARFIWKTIFFMRKKNNP